MLSIGKDTKIWFGLVVTDVAVSVLTFIVNEPYTLVSMTLI